MNTRDVKKEYIRKLLNASLSNKKYSTVIFRSSFALDEIKDVMEELKDEFGLERVIYIDFDLPKIIDFYNNNPSEEDLDRFVPKLPDVVGNTKIIYFNNAITDLSNDYYSQANRDYFKRLKDKNPELIDFISKADKSDKTVSTCPNRPWANSLLGSPDRIDELWDKINNTVLDIETTKEEIDERVRRRKELERMKIRHLHFNTDVGTDLRISLNPHSLWACEPNESFGKANLFNYPSYEIYTSPNCYSAEGKIELTKKRRFYYDILVDHATFEFKKGKLVAVDSNDESFGKIVMNKKNKMNRIGEIALVGQDTPLAQTGEFYGSVILDENAGCHFALGNSIDSCINIPVEKLDEKGRRYYRYNTSKYHNDFIFGDDSIRVEAETKDKKKILLMDKGLWRI